ncbi:HAD-IC family P-type ATPase, partial [Clostridioides difficile]|nr:HAD-IC family P-type ATPase [Clostridioides difficile]
AQVVERTTVFAKLTPLQKARIVKALQANGHTVGFLGDGINDAPALRDADVGISVDSGADIAKAPAAIILLAKSL